MAYTNIDDPSAHFQTALYTGNSGTLAVTNDGNSDLKPDLVWTKKRSDTSHHALVDSSRGATKQIYSNLDAAEETVSGVTAFNTDALSTWRGAFRECVKLASKTIPGQVDEETEQRLTTWCTVGANNEFGKYAIHGAQVGKHFGTAHKDDKEILYKINDFEWLKEQYDEYKDSI